jgi:hypothetical protein
VCISHLNCLLVYSRFEISYHSTHEFKNSSDCRYEYHCAQLDNRRHGSKKNADAKKNADEKKQRDKGQMDMFPCGGWVTIWASPDESDCFVRIRHLHCHQKYVCIDLPGDVKKFINENPKLRAPQVSEVALDLSFHLITNLVISFGRKY